MLSKIGQRAALSDADKFGVEGKGGGGGERVPSSALLDLGYVELKKIIEPLHQLLSRIGAG
jgi:hypothetical protein